MNTCTPLLLGAVTETVSAWLLHAVVYGSLVAALTWLLVSTVFRKARPGVHALLWLVVLLKFVLPVGPGAPFSLASLVGDWTGLRPTLPQPKTTPECSTATGGVSYVFVESAPCAATPTQPLLAATAPSWSSLTWLIVAYAALVAGLALWRIVAYARFARRCAACTAADDAAVAVVAAVCRRLGVRRVPDVRVSDTAAAPFVLGVVRPRLVLARRHLSDAAELEAVVLHEIAHLRRGDLLVRHFQWLAGTLLFFWPVVAWVNRRIDLLREYACDEWALRHGRLSAGDYARCLLRAVQPVRPRWTQFRPAAMAATRVNVERRIDMILNAKTNAARRWMWLPIGSVVAAWGAFVLTGAAPASGAAAGGDDPLSWFSNAIEEQYSTQNGELAVVAAAGERTFVVLNRIDAIDGGEPIEMDVQVISGCGTGAMPFDIPLHGGIAPKIFIARSADGVEATGHFVNSFMFSEDSGEDLSEFLVAHPTSDANADGSLDAAEHNAYLAALAMSDPKAVMAQYPTADRNSDGALDATEAARLVTGGPELDGLPGHCNGAWQGAAGMPAGAPAGGMIKIFAKADAEEGDGQKRVIKMRTRIVGADGEEIAVQDADGAIETPADGDVFIPADGKRHVIVKKIVQDGGGPADVQITVNGQKIDAADAGNIAELKGLPCIEALVEGSPLEDGAGGMWSMKFGGPPAAHWLAENVTADVTAADVAKLIPAIEQAPLAAFLEMNPDSDANHDGKLTAEERDAFMERHMTKARTKLLERFPDADGNADGLLTNEELHEYFKNRAPQGEKLRIEQPIKTRGVLGPMQPGAEMGPPQPSTDGC